MDEILPATILKTQPNKNLNKNIFFLCSAIKFVLAFEPGQMSTDLSKAELSQLTGVQNPAQNAPISDYFGKISQLGWIP